MSKKSLIDKCVEQKLRLTDQRQIIVSILSEARDHPNVEEIHRRAIAKDRKISVATVYRTLKILEGHDLIQKHDFQYSDGRSRYEGKRPGMHDHIIDIRTGEVVEFHDERIAEIQDKIAAELGYEIVDRRFELYVVRENRDEPTQSNSLQPLKNLKH